jgi:hypothetical protein
MKLIISGVPCSGKTYFGDWLRDERAFAHANLEGRTAPVTIAPPNLSADLPVWLGSLAGDAVVTWGFRPHRGAFEMIARFQDAGFTPWWFHANPAVARARYIARDGIEATVAFFDPQMARIAHTTASLDAIYDGNTIETLSDTGYRSVDEIYATLAAKVA